MRTEIVHVELDVSVKVADPLFTLHAKLIAKREIERALKLVANRHRDDEGIASFGAIEAGVVLT